MRGSSIFAMCLALALLGLGVLAPPVPAVTPVYNIRIKGANVRKGRKVPIRVINRVDREIRLSRRLDVERLMNGRWIRIWPTVEHLYLRNNCKRDRKTRLVNPPWMETGCINIPAKSTFKAPPWLGTHGHAQCACDKCVHVPKGRYRFVARYCGRQKRIISDPFWIR